jgi:hypothetical protein
LTFTVFNKLYVGSILYLNNNSYDVALFYTTWPGYSRFKRIGFLSCSAKGQIEIKSVSDKSIELYIDIVVKSKNVYKYAKSENETTIVGSFKFKNYELNQLTPWLGAVTNDWNSTLHR